MRLTSLLSELVLALRWAYTAADDPFHESIARGKERVYAMMRRARDAEQSDHSIRWKALAEEQLDHVGDLETMRFKYFVYAATGSLCTFMALLWAVLLIVW
jgi:hypothetical protein